MRISTTSPSSYYTVHDTWSKQGAGKTPIAFCSYSDGSFSSYISGNLDAEQKKKMEGDLQKRQAEVLKFAGFVAVMGKKIVADESVFYSDGSVDQYIASASNDGTVPGKSAKGKRKDEEEEEKLISEYYLQMKRAIKSYQDNLAFT